MSLPRTAAPRRGQPLVALVLLLGGWVGVRAAILDSEPHAAGGAAPELAAAPALTPPVQAEPAIAQAAAPAAEAVNWPALPQAPAASAGLAEPALMPPPPMQSVPVRETAATPAADAPTPPRISGGHQMLWMAGLSMLPLPLDAGLVQGRSSGPLRPPALGATGTTALGKPQPAPAALRWSADGWIVWRQGGNGYNLPGAGLPGAAGPSGAYGASQAGVVVRYRLAPTSPQRPSLYLRGSSALQAPRGEEVAGGFSLRPVKGLPVAAMAEVRATRTEGGKVIVRPAVALVSELPAQQLPFGLRGEAYVQAGYVGGRDATPFVDGQARVEKPLVQMGPMELRAGGGVWGGAQNGAQRLDVGPTATLAMPVGPGGSRVSADWRFRVAGDAAPGSGPAITLSAGF
ncbi:hypothetical protein [Novosphingobium sp.]|uniref:hypothetical protein n=1 Tax=Novosphingobium sp. TaxID=1874826 RepID=UPI0035B225C4